MKNSNNYLSLFLMLCHIPNKNYFCLYLQNIMWEKENQATKPHSRKSATFTGNKMMGEGNDYVLKRFRLQENKLFKQKNNQELKYVSSDPTNCISHQEDIDDEIVIVPIEATHQEHQQNIEIEHQEEVRKQEDKNHAVFVFDDEEEQSVDIGVNIQKKEKEYRYEMMEPKIQTKGPSTFYEDMMLKSSARDNFSTAELLKPKNQQYIKKKALHDPNDVLEKLCQKRNEQKKQTIKANTKQKRISEQKIGVQGLKGVKISDGDVDSDISITIVDKRTFSITKLPSGIILKCIIKRTNSILNLMSPQFDLYLANGLKHVLTAKKYPLRNRQLFKFSIDPVKFNEQNLLGIMHANVNHNIYWLLDQPRRIGELDLSFIHLVLGYFKLHKNQLQRKFTVLLPPVNSQYQLAMQYEQNFIHFANFKNQIKTQLNNLQCWEDQTFNSTKNFVLADEDDPDYRYLQMKKQSDNVFELTIQHPLSPVQAMAIAMSRFDVQLN